MRYYELNNDVMQRDSDGLLQFDKDKEATRAYFLDYVNKNTVFFHSLREKLDYLFEHDYYERELFDQYTFDEIKKVYKRAYSYKFRFPSFMSAFKFYNDYALKTNDGKRMLERYEDRVSVNALFFGKGDVAQALAHADLLMTQQYQPATPTFLNVGRKRRGELVSCFLMEVGDSLNDINMAESTAKQLSKVGGGVSLNLTNIRAKGESIKDITNVAKGVVGVMKMLDHAFRYADQMGQRPGAGAAYLNVFHADIHDFLDTKKISSDEDVRVKTLSIGVVIPDKFIELERENKPMYVFYPHTVYQEYGVNFADIDIDEMYDELVANPKVRKDRIDARKLHEKISSLRFESGYPYEMFSGNVGRSHALGGSVKMSNLCVTGDTELLTDKGYIPAKELYESGEKLNVVIDNRTISMELSNEGVTVDKAIPMQLTAKQADVYKLSTKQGYEIKATAWHKFYVERDDQLIKIPLVEIQDGDRVLVQSEEGTYGNLHNEKLAFIMGVIAGDGTFTDKAVKIYLYDNKRTLAEKVTSIVYDIIADHLNVLRTYKHNTSFKPLFVESSDKSLLSLSSTVLHDILAIYGFTRESKTDVPVFIKRADKATQAAYLSGLYQTDACVNANFASKSLSVEYVTTNETAAKDTQKLLLNMGIFSTIYRADKKHSLLPDGKGGKKLYEVKPTYRVTVQDRIARERLVEVIELKEYDMYKFNLLTGILQPKSRRAKHHYTAEVESVEYIGKEDVYDTTQPSHHSLIFNAIVTGNCSEILQKSEPSKYTDYGQEDEIGLDISCNLGSLNITNVMQHKDIDNAVSLATDALTVVSESTQITNAPAIQRANNEVRSIGLGAMNLHGYLASVGIAYESPLATEFVDVFFAAVNYYSIKRSMEIAHSTGKIFEGFEQSNYADGSYFADYVANDYLPQSEAISELFEGFDLPTTYDWVALAADVARYGMSHGYRLAIAPTGSISYVQSATASVMPIMERIEERTYGNSKTYYPMPGLSMKTWFYYKEAYDMDMRKVVDLIATIQQHVDQGISFTLFLKDTMTTRDLTKIDLYAHHKGIKTLYYARTKDTSADACLACQV